MTDSPPKEVAFYYAQYVEVMKYGHDYIDSRLKAQLYEIIVELGVPKCGMFLELPPEEPKVIEVETAHTHVPIIHRNKGRLGYGDIK